MVTRLNHVRPTARRAAAAAILSLALAGCGEGDPGSEEASAPDASDDQQAQSTVVQEDFTALPDAAAASSERGTTQIRGGALVITPAERGVPMAESWPLPAAQRVTITAAWGASSGPDEPLGTWMLEVWGNDPGAGVALACWSDGTPAELVDLASRQVLAKAPDAACDSSQSMTLSIDNSADAPYSAITFQAGDAGPTAYAGDQRYPLEYAGYRVLSDEPGFSVALDSIAVDVG